jgi:hypothetical protein
MGAGSLMLSVRPHDDEDFTKTLVYRQAIAHDCSDCYYFWRSHSQLHYSNDTFAWSILRVVRFGWSVSRFLYVGLLRMVLEMKPWPNKSLQAKRDGALSSASRFTLVGLACLNSGR